MYCPRCQCKLSSLVEYFDFEQHFLERDYYCSTCKSAVTEKFHEDGSYESDWLDFNG